jgi:hypothetical protein
MGTLVTILSSVVLYYHHLPKTPKYRSHGLSSNFGKLWLERAKQKQSSLAINPVLPPTDETSRQPASTEKKCHIYQAEAEGQSHQESYDLDHFQFDLPGFKTDVESPEISIGFLSIRADVSCKNALTINITQPGLTMAGPLIQMLLQASLLRSPATCSSSQCGLQSIQSPTPSPNRKAFTNLDLLQAPLLVLEFLMSAVKQQKIAPNQRNRE